MKKIISGLLALGLVVAYSNIAWASLEDGLVAYFPLDINANDASGNANHGSEYGGVAYVDSMMGGAAEFDGLNDYIDIPYTAIIEPSVFSISFWVNSDKQDNQHIINTNRADSGSHGYSIKISQDGFSSFSVDPSSSSGDHVREISSDSVINEGTWHHVVAIYDADQTLSMYVDNIFQPDMAAGGYAKTHRSIRIGMQRCTSNIALRYYLQGCVDEVRIYNRVLSEPEIEQLYNEPLLAADAGTDQIVYDVVTLDGSLSNDPNGTIISHHWTLNHRTNSTYDRTAEEVNPTVPDLAPGFYDVTLTVENDSGSVNTDEMVVTAIGCKGDFDGDGDVDGSDLAVFAANFGRTDCPSCQ